MRRPVAITSATLLLAACSSTSNPSPTPSAPAVSSVVTASSSVATSGSSVATTARADTSPPPAAPVCKLKTGPNTLIRREVDPGAPPYAQTVGDVDLVHCKHTWETLTAPSGPGYCVQLAWAKDNPGYNVDGTPARTLRKVIASKGAGCRKLRGPT